MSHSSPVPMRAVLSCTVTLLAVAALASCGPPRRAAVETSASRPTVSYAYTDDQGLMEATSKAETYCAQYGTWPRAADFDQRSDDRHVTFVCDQARAAAPTSSTIVVPPDLPPVDYAYRDDPGLIDATNQAQRYCSGYQSNARSIRVTNNADGTRSVKFECVR